MPRELLPIVGGINQNANEIGLDQYGADLRDGYIDKLNVFCRRPALVEETDLGTGQKIDGLFWWPNGAMMLAVSNGHLYKKPSAAAGFSDMSSTDLLGLGIRPTFSNHGSIILTANGGKMMKFDGTNAPTFLTDADAPITVTHVAFMDNYALCNRTGTPYFYYSDPGSPEAWTGNFKAAEGTPDDVTGLYVGGGRILLAGPNSIETWINNSVDPFARQDMSTVAKGLIAPYSFCNLDGIWHGLSEDREFFRLEGNVPIPVSEAITRYVQDFGTVTDCMADTLKINGETFVLFHFPIEGKTLVYHPARGFWYEWCYWDSTLGAYARWRGNCIAYSPNWNLTLVGDRANGKIYRLDPDGATDNGATIRTMRRTGWVARETLLGKRCNGLYFLLKRTGMAGGGAQPNLVVKWRDNGSSVWSNELTVPIWNGGETEFIGQLSGGLGSYHKRQWEMYVTAPYPVAIGGVEEDYSLLSR